MPVDATSAATATTSDYVPGSQRVPQKVLGQNDFFKLLAVQLSSQDPLKPMEDTDFIAQMSSFSTLDMISGMTQSITALGVQQSYLNAQTLLGRMVTVETSGGSEVSGLATAIKTATDGSTNITIDGIEYPATSVVGVRIVEE